MGASGGNLGQLVVQLTIDQSTYKANLRDSQGATKQFADTASKAGDSTSESMDRIGVHTAGARREIVVMAHELATGNLKNFAGSAMVLAERMDLIALATSPVGLAIGAVVGVLGAFAVAAYKGHEESEALAKSLQVTGNYAGATSSSFAAMTEAIAASTGNGLGTARDGLQALVSSGRLTGQALELLGADVVRMHDLTGEKLDDIAKDYAKMPEGVAKWAEQHNASMHFIDTAQYEYIRSLEEAGDKQQAMLVVAKALDDQLRNESIQNVGALATAWRGVGSALGAAWDWMKSIGREETSAEKIAVATANVQRLQNALNGPALPDTRNSWTQQLAAAQAKLTALNQDALHEQDAALAKSAKAQTDQAGIEASDFLKKLRDQEKGIGRVNEALDEYHRKVADYNRANPAKPVSAAQQATDEAHIRSEFSDKGAQSSANRVRKSELEAALQTTKNGLDLIQATYKNADDQLQALHKATLISDQTFYNAEIALADDAAQRQIAAYAQEKAALQQAYWKAPADERIKITQEMGEIDTKVARVRQDNASKDVVFLTQQTDAQRKYLKSITDTQDALLAQAGISTPKALHDYDDRNRGAMLQAATTGDVSGAAFLDQNRQLTKLGAQYNDILSQAKEAQTKVSLEQQEGLTGLIDGVSQLRANSADTVSSLQALYDEANKLSWQTTDPGVLANLDQLRDKIRQSMLDSSNYLKDFTDAGRSAFNGLFQDIAAGTKTPAEAVKSMVVSMLGSLAQLFANQAYTGLIGALFSGSMAAAGGTGNSAYGFTLGSSIAGSGSLFGTAAGMMFSGGGLVSGPGSTTSDSIPARLSNGEYVVNAQAVAKPGMLSLLESLNGGRSAAGGARFARGGLVGSSAQPTDDVGSLISISTTVNTPVQGSQPAGSGGNTDARQLATQIDSIVKQRIAKETQQGGLIWRYVNAR
jgi:phage-related minor tail protein